VTRAILVRKVSKEILETLDLRAYKVYQVVTAQMERKVFRGYKGHKV
jgi:hypothetical protein